MNLKDAYKIYREKYNFPGVSKNFVGGTGHIGSKLFIIGEAPGREEDKLGIPFVGKSGQILDSLMDDCDFDDCFITNLFKYQPPGNRNPLPREISLSVPLLVAEIKIVQPKIIVPMGAIPTSVFTGEKLSKCAGKVMKWGQFTLIPTWHPARAAYDEEKYLPILKQHFKIIKEALND